MKLSALYLSAMIYDAAYASFRWFLYQSVADTYRWWREERPGMSLPSPDALTGLAYRRVPTVRGKLVLDK